ncbi:MAG: DNA replication and repair protein RecF, partial [Clostridia bacterium]|nr:DNA replication and repair protein RecF [Clostridia bacterium]
LSFLITKTRKNFVLRLEEFAKQYVKDISGGKEELSLKYVPSFDAEDENALYCELVKNRERDFEYGNTNAGAHKDDFETFLNGNDVKKFGSQGQQRSCVMSFKLAEAEITGDTRGEYPLILLDDVFSELDTSRREFITGKIMGKQVIITSCDPISSMENANKIYVENGGVTQG